MINEAGKPYIFADGEVTRAIITFTVAAEEARRQQGELLDIDAYAPGSGHFGLVRRFPLGVISAITPFNFPLNLVAHKVAPGMAAGNTLVVKPALKTPLSSLPKCSSNAACRRARLISSLATTRRLAR